ncbi:hypothetical protein Glove_142g19 [Diversispora epigaea]|uniref:Uncharacterized protein n=1 Tax=Diversispora epigaea TaxID=1348612 RepID=A0A397IX98_9GLOM|nr:hypothetical protein Glove_142g19 [Diversispora epigaea]
MKIFSTNNLHEHGAIIIVYYKMRILPATTRETKSEFFGKNDNGGHYYNLELMAILSYWYDWYKIEVRGWIFLEPDEAKTTIDSHYAIIAHVIKRYIRIGCELTSGKDIEKAIKQLSGISVVQIESNRDKNNDDNTEEQCNFSNKKTKTIPDISKWFAWNWSINGEFEGYV